MAEPGDRDRDAARWRVLQRLIAEYRAELLHAWNMPTRTYTAKASYLQSAVDEARSLERRWPKLRDGSQGAGGPSPPVPAGSPAPTSPDSAVVSVPPYPLGEDHPLPSQPSPVGAADPQGVACPGCGVVGPPDVACFCKKPWPRGSR